MALVYIRMMSVLVKYADPITTTHECSSNGRFFELIRTSQGREGVALELRPRVCARGLFRCRKEGVAELFRLSVYCFVGHVVRELVSSLIKLFTFGIGKERLSVTGARAVR